MKHWVGLSTAIGVGLLGACSNLNLNNLNVNDVMNVAQTVTGTQPDLAEPQEIELGRQWAATLTGASPLVQDVAVQRYVNRVGMWVAQQSERPNLPWHFGVLADDDINGFATPGGYVFVTRGLLLHMNSESELAGVLGHEIAHVVCKHQLHAIQHQQGMNSLGNLVQSQVPGASNNALTSVVSDRVLAGFKEVLSTGLDRGDELQADRMGVVLAARAGYDPFGLPNVLQMLQGLNAQDGAVALLFATHPAPTVRLDALDKAMGSGFDQYGGRAENTDRFRKQMKALVAAAGKSTKGT
jgi:predicted Zn-dependent protease